MIAENDEGRIAIDLKKRTITERLIIAESLVDSVIAESDQFREDTKKTDTEMNCDEWWKNYIRSRMSRDDGTDNNVDKSGKKIDWSE